MEVSNVKSIALTLGNVGNVPFNKTRRILSGLSMEEIEPCEQDKRMKF